MCKRECSSRGIHRGLHHISVCTKGVVRVLQRETVVAHGGQDDVAIGPKRGMRELERSSRGLHRGLHNTSVFLQPRFCKFERKSVVIDRSFHNPPFGTESRVQTFKRQTVPSHDAEGHAVGV